MSGALREMNRVELVNLERLSHLLKGLNPAELETLELLLDEDACATIAESLRELEDGKGIPLHPRGYPISDRLSDHRREEAARDCPGEIQRELLSDPEENSEVSCTRTPPATTRLRIGSQTWLRTCGGGGPLKRSMDEIERDMVVRREWSLEP
jgi:hypothetical protein